MCTLLWEKQTLFFKKGVGSSCSSSTSGTWKSPTKIIWAPKIFIRQANINLFIVN
eukprot:SAG11_NODE_21530_length_423_cov_1.413580_1_plen_54_part_01